MKNKVLYITSIVLAILSFFVFLVTLCALNPFFNFEGALSLFFWIPWLLVAFLGIFILVFILSIILSIINFFSQTKDNKLRKYLPLILNLLTVVVVIVLLI